MEAVSDDKPAVALIEALDSHGKVQWRERLALEGEKRRFTVGRALDADVTLDDPFAAALHAAIEIEPDGRVFVTDLDSVNGVVLAGKRHHGAGRIEAADGLLQIGRTRLRIRSSYAQLAPEQPDQWRPASVLRDPVRMAGIAALAGAAQLIYSTWLGAPRDLTSVVVTSLVSASLLTGVWVAFWAMLSRMVLGEWRWLRHVAIFLGVAVVSYAVDGVLDLAWFAFALPEWASRALCVGGLTIASALFLHLTNASNISARRAFFIACLVPVLFGGAAYWVQNRTQTRNVNYISSDLRIYPPGLRLRAAGTVDTFFGKSASLREDADARRDATRQYADDAEALDDLD